MAARKTSHPQRKPRAQSTPSRAGENIQSGGGKVGVKSGAEKSMTTRATRRSGGSRGDAGGGPATRGLDTHGELRWHNRPRGAEPGRKEKAAGRVDNARAEAVSAVEAISE